MKHQLATYPYEPPDGEAARRLAHHAQPRRLGRVERGEDQAASRRRAADVGDGERNHPRRVPSSFRSLVGVVTLNALGIPLPLAAGPAVAASSVVAHSRTRVLGLGSGRLYREPAEPPALVPTHARASADALATPP
jgi:hypothetical protein